MRVLVPIRILEQEAVAPGVIELLGAAEIVLLGYLELPDQTPPEQARLQFEDRATEALDDLADAFADVVETRLVFTHDREETIDRIAAETGATAYLIPGVAGPVEQLLVGLFGDVDVDRILDFVETLVDGRPIGVTLLHGDGSEAGEGRATAAVDRLRAAGIDAGAKASERDSAYRALVGASPGHDAIVIGERAPSLASFLLGDEAERVAREAVEPVLVVLRQESVD